MFLRAADLLSSDTYRFRVMAATMLGQGKTTHQAEIDAAAEMCDFWRFNVKFYADILEWFSEKGVVADAESTWNRLLPRGLEGFILAISPFNFTSIGGNLASAPALCGNVVIWKPSSAAVLSNYLLYECLEEAGLPKGVIQFLPGKPEDVVSESLNSEWLAGIHFTGSTSVFQQLWQQVAQNLPKYRQFPRLVGETGGKNFHLAHHSASVSDLVNQTIRSAFEYQGQKCSACSRLYLPRSMWKGVDGEDGVKKLLIEGVKKISIANCNEDLLTCFMGPVINEDTVKKVVKSVKKGKLVYGGEPVKDASGWSITPALVECPKPDNQLMTEELFAPVLAVHPYPDDMPWKEVLEMVNNGSQYGLTGAVFARDRDAIQQARSSLSHSCGNFYINDKCTGAVVGQQPFGGARLSGTNDKAGSALNLLRWISPITVKENFGPSLLDYTYPSNQADNTE